MMAAMTVPAASGESPAARVHLLNVPYLPQSESRCGGAAIAMLMRYWGATNVYAETFADLVDPAADGIHGADLLKALRSRGWNATSFRGNADTVKASLAATRPVVALILDRPDRFHYVVIVGWVPGHVIAHDPARAPFRILDEKAFQESWKASDYWSLVATPPPSSGVSATPIERTTSPKAESEPYKRREAPCAGMVDEGVRLAGTDDAGGARRLFELAAASCPDAAGPWREMAGLHALAEEWPLAAADARRALARDSSDAHAARILATALYLTDDTDGALDAWNRIGEPTLDLINIAGLERTRFTVATHTMGLEPQTTVTRRSVTAARRRLAELPSGEVTRVSWSPDENGRARVDAAVIERPVFPRSAVSIGTIGLRAMTDREAIVTIASPSGGGEAWTASWRWWEHRPRVALGFESPAPRGGVWGVSLFDERQSYEVTDGVFEESRRRADFHISNWTVGGIRWEGTVAVDRFSEADAHGSGDAFGAAVSVQRRFLGDGAFVETRAEMWAGSTETWTFAVGGEWRSNTHHEGTVLIARATDAVAGPSAPFALWPGAGTGQGREGLLRAHPLIDDGVIRDAVFGRHVIDGGVEWRRWAQLANKPIRIAPALFVDAGRAYRGVDSSPDRCQYDVGGGFRLAVPGSGVLRIDVAHGLRDGRNALSMGWGR
jgi:Peptidase C39 family